MNPEGRRLRDRLRRLERGMPAALPVEPGAAVSRTGRRRLLGVAAAALLGGVLLGVGGTLLVGPQSGPGSGGATGGSPDAPAGFYRSATPMSGPICAAILLPMDHAFTELAWTRIWWWPTDADDCSRRTDFVYVQWVRPERVQLAAANDATRPGISLSTTVELRSGVRYRLGFTLDPDNLSTIAGAIPTYADAGGQVAGVPLVSLDSFDSLQEVP